MTDAEAIEVALRIACAIFTSALALRAPSLRPHALAAIACAALYAARVTGDPRVAVAAYALWPGAACALTVAVVAHVDGLREHEDRGCAGRGGAHARRARSRFNDGLDKPLHSIRGWSAHALILAPFTLAAILLARLGAHLAPWWPLPLLAPNALPVLLALATYRRPVTWAHRCAYVLPCSAAADLATTWSGAPDAVRACVSLGTWAVFVGCCVGEARAPRELVA